MEMREKETQEKYENKKNVILFKKLIYDYTFWHLMPNIINPFVKGILPPISHIFWIKFYWSIYVSCEIRIQLWKSLVIEFWCIRKLIKDQKRSLVYLKSKFMVSGKKISRYSVKIFHFPSYLSTKKLNFKSPYFDNLLSVQS